MTVILDLGLKALMAEDQTVAVLWQDALVGETALLAKATNQDVEGFRGSAPIQTQWELGRFSSGSVLRLHLVIFDRPQQPYRFETFINVGASEQLACVRQLLTQKTLQIHFFNSQTEYVFTKKLSNSDQQRQQLQQLIDLALHDWEILSEAWDFDQTKALFQAQRPL